MRCAGLGAACRQTHIAEQGRVVATKPQTVVELQESGYKLLPLREERRQNRIEKLDS